MLIHPYFSQNYASIICQGLLSCPHIICKVFCPHKPVLEVFSIISCAATADIVTRFKKRDVAPSVIGKDDSMTLLAHIFSRKMAQRRDLTNFFETVKRFDASAVVSPPVLSDDTLSLISSLYEGTFRIGDKEAAATILLTPFLMAAIKKLRSVTLRNFMVDGEFVVHRKGSRGASDLAIIVSLCINNHTATYHAQ